MRFKAYKWDGNCGVRSLFKKWCEGPTLNVEAEHHLMEAFCEFLCKQLHCILLNTKEQRQQMPN